VDSLLNHCVDLGVVACRCDPSNGVACGGCLLGHICLWVSSGHQGFGLPRGYRFDLVVLVRRPWRSGAISPRTTLPREAQWGGLVEAAGFDSRATEVLDLVSRREE
jgi:hypothetical protein